MGSNIHLNGICRICLHELKDHALNLCSKYDESRVIIDKIFSCFQITLSLEKFMPNAICNKCIEELNVADNFRIKCLTFEERFASYCKKTQFKTNPCNDGDCLDEDGNEIQSDVVDNNYSNILRTSHEEPYEPIKDEPTDFVLGGGEHIDMENNSFKCNICNKILKSKTSLMKHKLCMHENRKHSGTVSGYGSSRRYHCTKCSYSTPHSQTLVNHMRRHDGTRPYRCHCGKCFTQSSSLAAHLKIHSSATYYTCSVCGKQFKHAFTLKKHLLVHESGSFRCEICHKTLKTKQTLHDHMHRHYDIRNYNCEDCGDTFVTSSELVNHRQKHSIKKKVECHLCGYETHTKKNLIVHLKRHAGNRAFKCGLCELTFYTGGDMRRHRRVHTREKPYACPTCAQRFTHSPSLNKHMHNVHGIQFKWADFKIKGHNKD